MEFVGTATPLTEDDIDAAAERLGCRSSVVHAVRQVESGASGFLTDKRPKILDEAHEFHRLTFGRYDRAHPNISAPRWDRSLYGAGGAHQYDRLHEAILLDRRAALESASWGMFQVLGVNHDILGYQDVEAMVAAMMESERRHLDGFVVFVEHGGHAVDLRDPVNYPRFAAFYNGTGQVMRYAGSLSAAERLWTAKLTRADHPIEWHAATPEVRDLHQGAVGPDVADVQRLLNSWGVVPALRVDGDFGPDTADAVAVFRDALKLAPGSGVDQATRTALMQATRQC